MIGLKRRTVTGVAWSTFARGAYGLIQFVTTIILVRSLLPEDYGLLGMAAVFIGFASLLADFGFSASLIQLADIEEVHMSSVFWLHMAIGTALGFLFFLGAPFLAAFYETPALAPVARVLAVTFVITAAGGVPISLLQRRMTFDRLAWAEINAAVVAGGVAIAMALNGFGVWSLVVQLLLMNLCRTGFGFYFAGWRPQRLYSRSAIRQMLHYSGNLFGFNFINYWARNSDGLLIGKVIGSGALGIYTRGFSLLAPTAHVVGILTNVMFPALSSIQGEPDRVARVYLRTVRMIALVNFPFLLALLVVADSAVAVLFGDQWLSVGPVLKILCLLGVTRTVHSTLGWIFVSQGRTDLMFRWGAVSSTVTIVALLLGALQGSIAAVAWAYVAVQLVLLYPSVAIAGSIVGMRVMDVARVISGAFACAVGMAVITWGVGFVLPVTWPEWIQLTTQLAVAGVSYAVLIIRFDLAGFRDLKNLLIEHRKGSELDVVAV